MLGVGARASAGVLVFCVKCRTVSLRLCLALLLLMVVSRAWCCLVLVSALAFVSNSMFAFVLVLMFSDRAGVGSGVVFGVGAVVGVDLSVGVWY